MKKISNSEEANHYYKLINDSIDEYINTWKIKPSNLSKYLKTSKFEKFLDKRGLSDVEGINRILTDVIEDRSHMESDGIMKFESFLKESKENIFSNLSPSFKHEKALADFYNTSLGHIKLINGDEHTYLINDFGKHIYAIVCSEYEFGLIGIKFENESFDKICKKYINDDDLIFDVNIKDIIDENKYRDLYKSKVSESDIIEQIEDKSGYKFKSKYKDYFIWDNSVKL